MGVEASGDRGGILLSFEEFKQTFDGFSNDPLAAGGQKVVYKASHPEYGKVVVKVLKEKDERTSREIKIMRENHFRAVPKIFDCANIMYQGKATEAIIEEYVEGVNLRELIESGRRFELREAADFLQKSLEFLAEISEKRIVHRDIKPENIIMVGDNPVFLDFGIARILDASSLTQTGGMGPNTPGYAAPEQFTGLKDKIDDRADLFSIGVVTYELITGKNPFRENACNVYQIYNNTVTVTPATHQIPGDTQLQFMGLLTSLMSKQIAARPKNANQALDWLESARSTFSEVN